jgi:hypothetical protein
MNTNWFGLHVSVIASVAELTLSVAVWVYLISLSGKNRDARLFAGYKLTDCLYFAIDVLYNLVAYPPVRAYTKGLSTIMLGVMFYILYGLPINLGAIPTNGSRMRVC